MRQTLCMQAIEIWDRANETVKAVAWPGVVAFGMLLFRTKLGELFQRLREAATPAGTMKFDPSEQGAADLAIAVSAGSLVEKVKAEVERTSEIASGQQSGDGALAASTIDMRGIKEDVEAVITTSFSAGFSAAHSVLGQRDRLEASRSAVRPVITWSESTPLVGYWSAEPGSDVPEDLLDYMVATGERDAAEHRMNEISTQVDELDAGAVKGTDDGVRKSLLVEYAQLASDRNAAMAKLLMLSAKVAAFQGSVATPGVLATFRSPDRPKSS